ncbi:MAG: ABC transporter ATP-binding protein [Clostridia bacterium]|nr:ABC transporter ATP-binding protein [Clostridia bacterium]
MIAIETNKLTKRFKEKIAVKELDLAIEQGEMFALLGVNGAGKSTTIKMLSCLSKPTSGQAFLLGRSVMTDAMAIKEFINVSPQETAIAQNLTVRENLEMICGIYGHSKADAKQKAQQSIDEFGMEEIALQKVKTLSGGWQRRLSIALALISEPQVLFLDEPTLGLDVLARRELWAMIEKLKGKITIILTTHYLEEAEALADRIGIMSRGRLIAVGTARELINKAGVSNFEDAFVKLAGEGETK